MLKYANYDIVVEEVPEEVSLAINISNCPCHCEGCHSSYLAENIGDELTPEKLDELIDLNKGITCVAFMGGDLNPEDVVELARKVRLDHHDLKTAWYSGRPKLAEIVRVHLVCFDFIKLGPYIPSKGGLDNPNTNQRFFRIGPNKSITDLTYYFQKKNKDI